MRRLLSIFTFIIILQSSSFAQKDTILYDKDWKECKRNKAAYYRIVIKREKDYLVKDIYISGRPQMIAECSAVTPRLYREGKCTFYNESGIIISEGNYHNESPCGIFMEVRNKGKDTLYNYQGLEVKTDSIYYNRLYIGIDNPVKITACNISPENLRVTTTQGTIKRSNGNYIVTVNS